MSSSETTSDQIDMSATDDLRSELVVTLTEELGEALVTSQILAGTDLWVRVGSDVWVETARVLREICGMTFFNYLSAIDWQPSPFGRDMDAQVDLTDREQDTVDEIEWGITGGGSRFQLLARVHNLEKHLGVHVKTDVEGNPLAMETWTGIYPGANWHEREVWEMFGISFLGHPNLTHLYLPSDFEGNPLRKDYPLLARRAKPWPGIVDVELMPGEDADEADDPDLGEDL